MKSLIITIATFIVSAPNVVYADHIAPASRDKNNTVMTLTQQQAVEFCRLAGGHLPSYQEVREAWMSGTLESDGIVLDNPSTADSTGRTFVWTSTISEISDSEDSKNTYGMLYSKLEDDHGLASTVRRDIYAYAVRCLF